MRNAASGGGSRPPPSGILPQTWIPDADLKGKMRLMDRSDYAGVTAGPRVDGSDRSLDTRRRRADPAVIPGQFSPASGPVQPSSGR